MKRTNEPERCGRVGRVPRRSGRPPPRRKPAPVRRKQSLNSINNSILQLEILKQQKKHNNNNKKLGKNPVAHSRLGDVRKPTTENPNQSCILTERSTQIRRPTQTSTTAESQPIGLPVASSAPFLSVAEKKNKKRKQRKGQNGRRFFDSVVSFRLFQKMAVPLRACLFSLAPGRSRGHGWNSFSTRLIK